MNTNDVEQHKVVVLTPRGNKQEAFKGDDVTQNIKVITRNVESVITVERTFGKVDTCYLWGDPHVIPFDETRSATRADMLRYLVIKPGFNHVVTSENFNIQDRHFEWYNADL